MLSLIDGHENNKSSTFADVMRPVYGSVSQLYMTTLMQIQHRHKPKRCSQRLGTMHAATHPLDQGWANFFVGGPNEKK
jgi:hypothetical protein